MNDKVEGRLSCILDEYKQSQDPDKHRGYARVICLLFSYGLENGSYQKFLGYNKILKNGNPSVRVGARFNQLLLTHTSENQRYLHKLRTEVANYFHGVELKYGSDNLEVILQGVNNALLQPIQNTISRESLMASKVSNKLAAGAKFTLGELFDPTTYNWQGTMKKRRGVGNGILDHIGSVFVEHNLDPDMTYQEYKLLKSLLDSQSK